MNKVQRVRAALAGAPVDQVPASFWFHFRPDQAVGEASVRAHLEYYRASGIDYLKVMNEHRYRAPDCVIHAPADWRRLRPAPLSAPFYQQQLDELKRILDALAGECLVITTIFNPFASGNHTSDYLVTEHLKVEPESVTAGLATIAESLVEFAIACVDAGASGIYYSAQGGEAERFSEHDFVRYIKPHDLTVLNAVRTRGEFNLLHICKDHIRLPLYVDYPAHAVNWAATKHNPSLKEGKDLFKRTIVGGMDDRGVMVTGSPSEITATAEAVIRDFGPNGFMLGADCTLPTDVPIDNIIAACQATGLNR